MAELDLLLEAERRGILPEDKVELLAEAKRRGLVGESEPYATRMARQFSSYVPGSDRIKAAAGAGFDALTGTDGTFGDNYASRLAREQALTNRANSADWDMGDLAAKTAGATASAVMTPFYAAGKTLWELSKESAKFGAGYGGIQAGLDSQSDSAMGKVGDIGTGVIGGGVVGGVIPPAFAAPGYARSLLNSAWEKLSGRTPLARQRMQQQADEMVAAGVPREEIFGPALPEGGDATAQRLSRTLAGRTLQPGAQRNMDRLQARVDEELRAGGMGSLDTDGSELQDMARRNLTDRNINPDLLVGMSDEELAAIRGNPNYTFKDEFGAMYEGMDRALPPQRMRGPPVETGTGTRKVTETASESPPAPGMVRVYHGGADQNGKRWVSTDRAYAQGHADKSNSSLWYHDLPEGDPRINNPDWADQGVKQGFTFNFELPPAEARQMRRLGQRTTPSVDEAMTDGDLDVVVDMWKYARDMQNQPPPLALNDWLARAGGVKDTFGDLGSITGGERVNIRGEKGKFQTGLVNKGAGMDEDQAALRAWQEGFFPESQDRPSINQFLDAVREDAAGNTIVRGVDREFLEAFRDAQKMQADLERLGVTIKMTEPEIRQLLAAKAPEYERLRFVPTSSNRTNELLNEFRSELRSAGLLKGDDAGKHVFATPASGQIKAELEKKIGKELTDRLWTRKPIGIRDMRKIRTLARYAAEEPNRTPIDRAFLKRLEGAVSGDMHGRLGKGGPDLKAAAAKMMEVDAGYRAFQEEVVEPLRGITGHDVSAAQALQRLADAAGTGKGANMDLMRAMYRVAREKGSTRKLTAGIVGQMHRGSLRGFVESLNGMSPEARRLMFEFNGGPTELGQALQRFAKAAKPLLPYLDQPAVVLDLSRVPYTAIAGGLLAGIEAAVVTYAGQAAMSRFMASPAYVRWLTRAAQTRTPGAWRQHVGRLAAIAEGDAETGQAILEAVGSVLRPGDAKAGPGGHLQQHKNAPGEWLTPNADKEMEITRKDPRGRNLAWPDWDERTDEPYDNGIVFPETVEPMMDDARNLLRNIGVGPNGLIADLPQGFPQQPKARRKRLLK